MMDILLVRQHCIPEIQSFLSVVFECSVDRVKIFSAEAFNSLTQELDDSSFDCVCVFSSVRGDVAQLLQLYRYKVSNTYALRRTIEIALHSKVHCYVPSGSLGGWIYVGDGDVSKYARQIESDDEDFFVFKADGHD